MSTEFESERWPEDNRLFGTSLVWTDNAVKVMKYAREAAGQLDHSFYGTGHILLGLVSENFDGVGAQALRQCGVELYRVRAKLTGVVNVRNCDPTGWLLPSPRTGEVFEAAEAEAKRLKCNRIGTGHLLLGLLSVPNSCAGPVLQDLGVTLEDVREAVKALLGPVMAEPKVSGMTWMEAMEAVRQGHRVRSRNCTLWPIYLSESGEHLLFRDLNTWEVRKFRPTNSCYFAEDWEIAPDECVRMGVRMGFIEAFQKAKEGHRIARLGWDDHWLALSSHRKPVDGNSRLERHTPYSRGGLYVVYSEDIDADDWVVVDEAKDE